MESQRRYSRIFGLLFFAVLIGVPFFLFNVVTIFIENLNFIDGFWFVTWITASSVMLQFWVFCRWSGKGPDKVWKPVAILHTLIFPGMYGVLLISRFGADIQASINWETFYWVWGIGSLLLSLWLPFTGPFAVLEILKKQFRLLVIPTLIFLPEVFAYVVYFVYVVARTA